MPQPSTEVSRSRWAFEGFRRELLTLFTGRQLIAQIEGKTVRVMLLIKGDPEWVPCPARNSWRAMGRVQRRAEGMPAFSLDLAGLHPSGEGKRVRFSGGERAVVDGPFGEKDEVVGYWILNVPSMEDAVALGEASALRSPRTDLPRRETELRAR